MPTICPADKDSDSVRSGKQNHPHQEKHSMINHLDYVNNCCISLGFLKEKCYDYPVRIFL